MTEEKDSRQINLRLYAWREVDELAAELAQERGTKKELTKTVVEAVRFMKMHRKNPALLGDA